jgi:hypothetical protein
MIEVPSLGNEVTVVLDDMIDRLIAQLIWLPLLAHQINQLATA